MLDRPVQMILEVLANAGQIMDELDVVPADFAGGADPGQKEKLRRIDRAAAKDHFPVRADLMSLLFAGVFDANRAAVLDKDARRLSPRDDGEIGPLQDGRQVARGGARPPAIGNGAVDGAEALLARAVEIVRVRVPGLLARLDPGQRQRTRDAGPRHLQRAAAAMMRVSPRQVGLRLFEIGQDIVPGPAAIAKLRPQIVIAGYAPYIDHGVHRAGPAQHPAARPEQRAPVHSGLRLGMVAPVDDAGLHKRWVSGGHMDQEILVARTGFQKGHFEPGIGRQPVCQDAPRRPAPDNDVIVGHGIPASLFQI